MSACLIGAYTERTGYRKSVKRKIHRWGLFRILREFRFLRRNIIKFLRRPWFLGLCYRVPVPKLGNRGGSMAALLWQLHEHTSSSLLHWMLCKLVYSFPAWGRGRGGAGGGIRTAAAAENQFMKWLRRRAWGWLKLSSSLQRSWNALDGKVIRHCGGIPVVHHTAPSDQRESHSLAWQPTAHSRQMYI